MICFTRVSQQNSILQKATHLFTGPGAMPPVLRRLTRSVQRRMQSFFDGTNREVGWGRAIHIWRFP